MRKYKTKEEKQVPFFHSLKQMHYNQMFHFRVAKLSRQYLPMMAYVLDCAKYTATKTRSIVYMSNFTLAKHHVKELRRKVDVPLTVQPALLSIYLAQQTNYLTTSESRGYIYIYWF
jgi:hypothetical protein